MKFYILATFCESFTAIGRIVLGILCVERLYPQYSGVLETCLALRNWFFENELTWPMWHTKMHFPRNAILVALLYSGLISSTIYTISIQNFRPYTFRVQKMCVFARYATLVPRLEVISGHFSISFFWLSDNDIEMNFLPTYVLFFKKD